MRRLLSEELSRHFLFWRDRPPTDAPPIDKLRYTRRSALSLAVFAIPLGLLTWATGGGPWLLCSFALLLLSAATLTFTIRAVERQNQRTSDDEATDPRHR